MVDFFWLKSFTEIVQLFLSVLFLIYIQIKYSRKSNSLIWLSTFFYIKIIGDIHGVVNFTDWISSLIATPLMKFYFISMATIELSMLISLFFYAKALNGIETTLKQGALYVTLSLLLIPINYLIVDESGESVNIIFILVRLSWISLLGYSLIVLVEEKNLKVFSIFALTWNLLWLSQVLLGRQLGLIFESLPWFIFVFAELIFVVGITFYLIKAITSPKILLYEDSSNLFPKRVEEIIEANLKKVMLTEKLYLDPELTISKLATAINIPQSDVSNYLNKVIRKNFNQFLNEYRIEESKLRLINAEFNNNTIEQIMYDSGFSSKSVFNTAFKANTGVTPSKFRKMNQ